MRSKLGFLLTVLLLGILLFYSCRHQILNPAANNNNGGGNTGYPPPVSACSPDSVYFVNEIMPIISSNCTMSGCHDNITHAEGLNLTTYSGVMRIVSPGKAAGSKLYTVVIKTNSDRMPPSPMAPLTTEQKIKIQKWINQGARNNNCIGSCDTAVYTYSGAVKLVIQNKCVGCHNPSSLGGNIDLSAYNNARTVALNGKLLGSVSQQPGYSPMPKNAAKLSDCEIRQIQKWINAGSLNN